MASTLFAELANLASLNVLTALSPTRIQVILDGLLAANTKKATKISADIREAAVGALCVLQLHPNHDIKEAATRTKRRWKAELESPYSTRLTTTKKQRGKTNDGRLSSRDYFQMMTKPLNKLL